MRDYGKIHSSFWTSEDLRGLSDGARLLAAYLLTGPHTNSIGCFRLPDGYICDDLGWEQEVIDELFMELSRKGFATRDDATNWVFVRKFMKWNPIENPNQGKGAQRLFEKVPNSCALKPYLVEAIREFADQFPEDALVKFEKALERVEKPLPQPFRDGLFEGYGEGMGNQEQEKEQEQEIHTSPPTVPDDEPKRKRSTEQTELIQTVVTLWNELAASIRLPQVQHITPKRQSAILARAKDLTAYYDFSEPISGFQEEFNKIRGSPFLRGEVNGFRCDLDFAMRQSSFTAIMEGKYAGRKG